MEIKKELLESIEQLGNQLEIVEQLSRNISNNIRKVYGVHSYNFGTLEILHVNREILSASISYTEFLQSFFKKLNEKHTTTTK